MIGIVEKKTGSSKADGLWKKKAISKIGVLSHVYVEISLPIVEGGWLGANPN